jgi:hypothetical protein
LAAGLATSATETDLASGPFNVVFRATVRFGFSSVASPTSDRWLAAAITAFIPDFFVAMITVPQGFRSTLRPRMPFAVPHRMNRCAATRKTFKTFNSFFLSDRLNVCNSHTEFFQLLL